MAKFHKSNRRAASKTAVFLCWLLLPGSHAFASIYIDATQSDYLGEGKEYYPGAIFFPDSVGGTGNINRMHIDADDWFISVTMPNGDEFAPGNYDLAFQNYTGIYSTLPSLNLSWSSRACSNAMGHFVIHDVAFDVNDDVERLAMDFQYYCPLTQGFIYGEIRYNTIVPAGKVNASAGRDRIVDEGWRVDLDAGDSYAHGHEIVSYKWSQVSGSPISFQNANQPETSFIAPYVPPGGESIVVRLEVTDSENRTDSDEMEVRVQDTNDPHSYIYKQVKYDYFPVAGDFYMPSDYGTVRLQQNNAETFTVSYQGLYSHIYGTVDYRFRVPQGQQPSPGYYVDIVDVIAGGTLVRPGMEIEYSAASTILANERKPGRFFIHELTYDADGNIDRLALDFMEYGGIYTHGMNRAVYGAVRYNSSVPLARNRPYAVAKSNSRAHQGEKVILDGRYSDSGSDILYGNPDRITDYRWRQVSGMPAQIFHTNSKVALFIAPQPAGESETLVFELTVTDSVGFQDSDLIEVEVLADGAPRSIAVLSGEERHAFDLAGKAMLFDGQNTLFGFNFTYGNGVAVDLKDGTPRLLRLGTADNSPLAPGYHETLDGDFLFPVVSMGFFGTCYDQHGALNVHSLTSESAGDTNTLTGLYADFEHYCGPPGQLNKATGFVKFNHPHSGIAPVANAGMDVTVYEGDAFTLDGSASTDADGNIIGYDWWQLDGRLQGWRYMDYEPKTVAPELIAKTLPIGADSEELLFQLNVFDNDGLRSSDLVKVTVLRSNQAPKAVDDTIYTPPDTAVDINMIANDYDPDGVVEWVNYGRGIGKTPDNGETYYESDGKARYIPREGFIGTDTFEYYVVDNRGAYSQLATVTVNVGSIPPAPDNSGDPDNGDSPNPGGARNSAAGGGGAFSPWFLILIICWLFRGATGRATGKRLTCPAQTRRQLSWASVYWW